MLQVTLYCLDTLLARIIPIILESFLIRAGIQDPRPKIPPVLARIIRIILESLLIRAGIQDPRHDSGKYWIQDSLKQPPRNLGSWIPAQIKNDPKMIQMSQGCLCKDPNSLLQMSEFGGSFRGGVQYIQNQI